jgi:TPR repeat protein
MRSACWSIPGLVVVAAVLLPGERALAQQAGANTLEQAEELCSGSGGSQDLARAREAFGLAAASADPVARLRLALLQTTGACGFALDLEAAERLAADSLAQVEALAPKSAYHRYLIGKSYLEGTGRTKQPEKALPWLEQAATAGEHWAMFNLGRMHHGGLGVERNPSVGIDWFEESAELGNAWAAAAAGDAYLGAAAGRVRDSKRALQLFERAAAVGNSGAMTRLGEMYSRGDGVGRNQATAVEWYQKAAARGGGLAMYHLAHIRFRGQGLPRDYEAGRDWMERSAKTGFYYAIKFMARHSDVGFRDHRSRQVLEPDIERATTWYERAAERGDKEAQGWLIFQRIERAASR